MTFQVNGQTYDAQKMDAFTQWLLFKRIVPLFSSGALEVYQVIQYVNDKGLKNVTDIPLDVLARYLPPVMHEISKMPDEDSRYIMVQCLTRCTRQTPGGGWAPVMAPGAVVSNFEDINGNMIVMIRVIAGVILTTFDAFFLEALSS